MTSESHARSLILIQLNYKYLEWITKSSTSKLTVSTFCNHPKQLLSNSNFTVADLIEATNNLYSIQVSITSNKMGCFFC